MVVVLHHWDFFVISAKAMSSREILYRASAGKFCIRLRFSRFSVHCRALRLKRKRVEKQLYFYRIFQTKQGN
jgi:hypothetical protein